MAIVNAILETNGFNVVSAICKVGNVPKAEAGISPDHQFNPYGAEAMCNPILQAELMNEAAVDFSILFGLCVGHDTLALRYARAPVTVLTAKDRVQAHDPLNCLHTYSSYSAYLKKPIFPGRHKTEGETLFARVA